MVILIFVTKFIIATLLVIIFHIWVGLVDERTGSQIQNLLICIEMLLASLLHYYIFPHREWAENYKRDKERQIQQGGAPDMLALKDFV